MNTVNVEYIGKKEFAVDNVAHSGQTWDGPGSVRAVTPAQAKLLTAYTDQWRLENQADAEQVNQKAAIKLDGTDDGTGNATTVHADELSGPLEKMSATQLVVFAQHKYGKKLRLNLGRTKLLNEVEEIVRTNDPIA